MDNEKRRVHEIEALLELFSSDGFIFRPSELYKIEAGSELRSHLERYNIYLICRRPRFSLAQHSLYLNIENQTIIGEFVISLPMRKETKSFEFRNPLSEPINSLGELEYPFDKLRFVTVSGFPIEMRISDMTRFLSDPFGLLPHSQLLVEYVGQAFGSDGNRYALDRLIGETGKQGHGSLQKILSDLSASYLDDEVFVVLYSFEFYKKHLIAGGRYEPEVSFEDASDRFENFMKATLSRKKRIDLVEAALIRCFQPTYNEKYKKTFPKENHTILDALYDLDITGLGVSLSTEESFLPLCSSRVSPSCQHVASYPITNELDRATYFGIVFG